MSEIRVGVKDLKSRMSEYLRQVRQGHTLIITAHGRPVGRLLPIEEGLEVCIKAFMEAGMVSWNGQKLRKIKPVALNRGEQQVSDILVEMRA